MHRRSRDVTDGVHPSLDELADLHEGLLPEERLGTISAHVASCPDCAAAAAALDDVRTTLATAGSTPIAMPESVSVALYDALERAGRERAADVASLTERRTRPRTARRLGTPRWVAAAAGAAAAVMVGYVGFSVLNDGSGLNPSQADSADSAGGATGKPAGTPTAGHSTRSLTSPPPGKSSLDFATPRALAGYAAALAGSGRREVTASCTPPGLDLSGGDRAATIRWRGVRALVVVHPARHRATVYACSDAARLFSTGY
jgi:hypothetical protein